VTVVLVGFMGAGKTTVGRILAERLGLSFVDSDVFLEHRSGRSIKDIFAAEGEAFFRELEHRTIAELVRGEDAVLALGGGALGDRRTRGILRDAPVVYLRVGYAEAMKRVRNDEFRPMLRRPDLETVYQARLPAYEDAADFTVDTADRRPDEVALEILDLLDALPKLPAQSSHPQKRTEPHRHRSPAARSDQ
jgi:shikimate kinase / 3-dehydroquinate synthase